MRKKSDQELMKLIEQKHRSAFEELYDRYINLIYSYSLKITKGNQEKAKEIVQHVFLRIWTTKSRYDPNKGLLINWLITVTRNISIDFIRKEKKHEEKQQMMVAETVITQESKPFQNIHIEDAKKRLTDEQQRLIRLLYWEGYSLREIAAMEEEPIGTVKSRLHQSLKRMRQHLKTEKEGRVDGQ
ncbi:RNA polymerase sigma factor [Scopulibacillus darangshiensis]|uniref:RNA polymerase sigma factor n=1 Tax=Scopulibacillus darangshiensis TaxID=442528 RepID=UPI0010532B0B|nr:sigma-70 family RNA polymerase sigma factor [Scopulibacillus darangshiensis]